MIKARLYDLSTRRNTKGYVEAIVRQCVSIYHVFPPDLSQNFNSERIKYLTIL